VAAYQGTPMIHNRTLWLALSATLVIYGCGNSSQPAASMSATSPSRGQLLQSPPTEAGTFSAGDLLADLTGGAMGSELQQLLQQLPLSVGCTVTIYHLEYQTVGGTNEPATASGALMVPSGVACAGPSPIVLYAHGTTPDKGFNIADMGASDNAEGLLLALLFASEGYIVVAPNYAGYDTSDLPYHPYLNGAQQSKDMIDCLTAAQTALATLGVSSNHKVFITGYSQGGFVAMQTHSAMQAAGMTVTASAPMSGPYALAAFGDAVFEGEVGSSETENVVLLTTSYQHSYGNVYANATDLFEAPYAAGADELLPSTTPISTLYSEGKLPQSALFSSTPPAPQYAALTPATPLATQPANLALVFAQGFGTGNLVTNSYRETYIQDAQAQPDGGFPTVTTGLPAAAPVTGIRDDLKLNDLRDWVPAAPVLLCAGANDPTVFYINTELMQDYWTKNAPTSASISVLDVDSPATVGDPYAVEKVGFAAAKAAAQVTGGDAGVLADYHATLVPPFCFFAVKSFFDSH